jgi:hypothetical protein
MYHGSLMPLEWVRILRGQISDLRAGQGIIIGRKKGSVRHSQHDRAAASIRSYHFGPLRPAALVGEMPGNILVWCFYPIGSPPSKFPMLSSSTVSRDGPAKSMIDTSDRGSENALRR